MATIHERETFGKCAACGGDILEGEKSFYCSNYKKEESGGKDCKVHLPKLIMGQTFNKVRALEFFIKGESDVLEGMTKEGNSVKFKMIYDGDKRDVVAEFQNSGQQSALGKCPKCGKDVYTGSKGYFCSGYKDEPPCSFILWKEGEGAKFSPDMAKRLLAGEELENVPCFTKEGKEYKAGFRVNADGDLVKKSYGG